MTRTSSSVARREGHLRRGTRDGGAIVALVGVDGSGKTTVAQQLAGGGPWPSRYLYMGQSLGSSNALLPSSAAARALRRRADRARTLQAATAVTSQPRRSKRSKYSRPRSLLAMANRVLEAWWRGRGAARDRRRGVVVVYDRYIPLEATIALADPGRSGVHALDRLERRLVERLVPRPDLVIHLDTPGEVASGRKGEATARRLERWRRVIEDWGAGRREFVRVDATRPLAEVVVAVQSVIEALLDTSPSEVLGSGYGVRR